MDPLGIIVGAIIAAVLVVVAAYFVVRQRATLRSLHFDDTLSAEQRRYYLKQCHRRIFGSVMMLVLASLMIGSFFLDLSPAHADKEEAKQSLQFLSLYVMTMVLVLLVILILAIIDFWATAKFSFRAQKELLQEHREMLEAELMEHRHRQSDLN